MFVIVSVLYLVFIEWDFDFWNENDFVNSIYVYNFVVDFKIWDFFKDVVRYFLFVIKLI